MPPLLLRRECGKREAEWKEREGRERLSRAEREEIKTAVNRALSERTLPNCRGVDFCWELGPSEVLFFSTAEKANESFRTLFEKTFQMKLAPVFPYSLALRVLGKDGERSADAAVAAVFAAREEA